MRVLILACLLAVALGRIVQQRGDPDEPIELGDEDITEEEFEEDFHILIPNSREKAKEAAALKKAEAEIRKHNELEKEGESSFHEKLFPWSNLPEDERKKMEGLIMEPKYAGVRATGWIDVPADSLNNPESEAYLRQLEQNRATLPTNYDSRDYGYISPVKNQGECGSCVSFASSAAIEACMKKAGGVLGDVSEQYFVDCGYDGVSANGCDGAAPNAYMKWMKSKEIRDLPDEGTDKYLGTRKNCIFSIEKRGTGAQFTNFVSSGSVTKDEMKDLIMSNGAVVSGINADAAFMEYSEGIFDQKCSSNACNHAITLIGWGKNDTTGQDYWIGKNSWGTSWGEKGFFKIEMGICGIASVAVAPICTNGGNVDPQPTTPPPPKSKTCNVAAFFGSPSLTGRYTVNDGTKTYGVTCTNSVCSLTDLVEDNVCIFICGRPDTC